MNLSKQLAQLSYVITAAEDPHRYCVLAWKTTTLLPAPQVHLKPRIDRDELFKAILEASREDPYINDLKRALLEPWRANALSKPDYVLVAYPAITSKLLKDTGCQTFGECVRNIRGPIAVALQQNILPVLTGLLFYQHVVDPYGIVERYTSDYILRQTQPARSFNRRAGESRLNDYYKLICTVRETIATVHVGSREKNLEEIGNINKKIEEYCEEEGETCLREVLEDLHYWMLIWWTHTNYIALYRPAVGCHVPTPSLLSIDPVALLEDGVLVKQGYASTETKEEMGSRREV